MNDAIEASKHSIDIGGGYKLNFVGTLTECGDSIGGLGVISKPLFDSKKKYLSGGKSDAELIGGDDQKYTAVSVYSSMTGDDS